MAIEMDNKRRSDLQLSIRDHPLTSAAIHADNQSVYIQPYAAVLPMNQRL